MSTFPAVFSWGEELYFFFPLLFGLICSQHITKKKRDLSPTTTRNYIANI